ncbi:MAG: hypothetical protein LC130_25720 [Bryobacterales bacterium]|nr:hypothetical protein [Bryobacterales bacterium]
MKYNHCFSDGIGTIYATPYSRTDDLMADAVPVCGRENDDAVIGRTKTILNEMLAFWSILNEDKFSSPDPDQPGKYRYWLYALRRFYSLGERITKIWGRYAADSIFNTLGFDPMGAK